MMGKQLYGKIIITASAQKELMYTSEGILFAEFDRFADELDELLKRWNGQKHTNNLTFKMEEDYEV